MKRFTVLLLFILAACGPAKLVPPASATPFPVYAPRAGDGALTRGNFYLDSASIQSMESAPVRYSVVLKGNLPTPCHKIRVVYNPPNAENKIMLEVYTVVDPNALCAQNLQPLEQTIYLGTFPSGRYTVWVNDSQVANFIVQ